MVRSGIPKKKPLHCGPCSKEDKKRRGLKKRQKRQYKNYYVPNKGPSRADSGSYYVLGKYRSPQIHPFGGPLLYVMFFMWPFLPASF